MITQPMNTTLYRLLIKAGASEEDAEEAASFDTSELATKADLAEQVAALRLELRTGLAEMRVATSELKSSLIQWMVGIVFTALGLQTVLVLALLARIGK